MIAIASLVAQNIGILLERLSMSQATLAEKSKLHKNTIQQILSAANIPNIQTLAQIATALEVDPSVLIKKGLEKVKLTGIKKIDTAIAEINNNLYKGPPAKKIIGKYFAKDYCLKYADRPVGDPLRVGPGLDEELKLNHSIKNSQQPMAIIRTAWVTGKQVHTLLEVRVNANTLDDTVAAALRADAHFQIAELIDTWMMEFSQGQIREENAPVKIERRLLKYLNNKLE